jgi:hypothetical protein
MPAGKLIQSTGQGTQGEQNQDTLADQSFALKSPGIIASQLVANST